MNQKPSRKLEATHRPKSINDNKLPKYSIAVASDLSGVSQQQLRRMEESGLFTPGRTEGNTRRYSDTDLDYIAEASLLAAEGVNMEGIRRILPLQNDIAQLREEIIRLREQLAQLTIEKDSTAE